MTFLLAQTPGSDAAANISEWSTFIDRHGVAVGILALLAVASGSYFWKVVLPREQGRTEDMRNAAKTQNETLPKIADATDRMAACVERVEGRFSTVENKVDAGFSALHTRLDNVCRSHPRFNPPASSGS